MRGARWPSPCRRRRDAWPLTWPPGRAGARTRTDRVPQPLSTGSDSRTESPLAREQGGAGAAVRMLCEHTGSEVTAPRQAIAAPPSATHSAATGTAPTARCCGGPPARRSRSSNRHATRGRGCSCPSPRCASRSAERRSPWRGAVTSDPVCSQSIRTAAPQPLLSARWGFRSAVAPGAQWLGTRSVRVRVLLGLGQVRGQALTASAAMAKATRASHTGAGAQTYSVSSS